MGLEVEEEVEELEGEDFGEVVEEVEEGGLAGGALALGGPPPKNERMSFGMVTDERVRCTKQRAGRRWRREGEGGGLAGGKRNGRREEERQEWGERPTPCFDQGAKDGGTVKWTVQRAVFEVL